MGPFVDEVETSENGLKILSLYQEFGLSVVNSFFEKTDHRRLTRYHPTGKGAVFDLILMKRSQNIQITDTRASCKADANSGRCLATVILKTKMSSIKQEIIRSRA